MRSIGVLTGNQSRSGHSSDEQEDRLKNYER